MSAFGGSGHRPEMAESPLLTQSGRLGPTRSVPAKKVKLCDDGHIAFAQSGLAWRNDEGESAMRKTLPIVIVAVLLTATVVDVVAAGVRTVTAGRHFYYAAPAGISVAVPSDMKGFPRELLPQ